MFCGKCGKEIDNDSTFCPFCGQKIVKAAVSGGKTEKPKASAKKPGKKMVIGLAAAAAVLLAVFGIMKIRGRGGSMPEKMFAMSWEEISELSKYVYKDMLDEADLPYRTKNGEETDYIEVKEPASFLDGDCFYLYAPDLHASVYKVRYETREDFKAGREKIEELLQKELLEKTVAFEHTYEDVQLQFYPVGMYEQNPDGQSEDLSALFGRYSRYGLTGEAPKEDGSYRMYKFVCAAYGSQSELSGLADLFSSSEDKDYADDMGILAVLYLPMREEDLTAQMALQGGYDMVSGETIDIDQFRGSVDQALVEIGLEGNESDDPMERLHMEKELYVRLYMMEKHQFDTDNPAYLKSDEERKLWYVRNFGWDTDKDEPVDLSDYRDSSSIYCAAECNYNSDTAEYFKNELDRALYLADRDYQADTGEAFGSADEKRLWFMKNYNYDTGTEKMVSQELVDALIAYQKYAEEEDPGFQYKYYGYNLLYIDEDDVPELLASGTAEAEGHKLITYKDGKITENYIDRLYGITYAEKKNLYMNSNGNMGGYYNILYRLEDGEQKELAQGEWGDKRDDEGNLIWNESGDYPVQEYFWNGAECGSEEEYYNAIDAFIQSIVGDVEMRSAYFGERYFNMLDAYDALRTTIYEAHEYCIYEYELKDGILTVKADDGANANTRSFGIGEPFTFSYPVSDDCIWEDGYGYDEIREQNPTWIKTPGEVEEEIKEWRKWYDNYPDEIESPVGIRFYVTDGEVVKVLTSTP